MTIRTLIQVALGVAAAIVIAAAAMRSTIRRRRAEPAGGTAEGQRARVATGHA